MSALVAAILSGGVAYFLAWLIHRKPPPAADDLAEYMSRVVATEDFEDRERRIRRQLFDADRCSLPNPESGSPARVSTMRLRR